MQTWKRFVFWKDELVTQPDSEPTSSSSTTTTRPFDSPDLPAAETPKKSAAARRELSKARKKEAHKGI